jgi:hypothetical protein
MAVRGDEVRARELRAGDAREDAQEDGNS